MARQSDLDKMSHLELVELRTQVDRLIIDRKNAERTSLREKMLDMAKQHGLSLWDLFGKGKGSVAVKYRDPKNPANTWTGRGRMPRWMAAATKGNKAKRDDFLV